MMDFDEILPLFGEFGKYQSLLIWLVLLPGNIPCALNAYNQIFMAKYVEHYCQIPDLQYLLPDNEELFKNISIPSETIDGKLRYSTCLMRNLNYTEIIIEGLGNYSHNSDINLVENIPCKHGWNYNNIIGESSIISEWDLVCEKEIYPTYALVFFGTGGLIGNLVFGYVQDGLGRKPAFFIYLTILCTFGIATAFANSFIMWTIFRTGVGFTIPAIMATPMVLALEIVGAKHRTKVNLLSNMMYSLGLTGLAIIVYFFRDWRSLSLVSSTPFLLYFLYWFVMPESPRWLISRGKLQEMHKVMSKMARVNNKSSVEIQPYSSLFTSLLDSTSKSNSSSSSYGILDLIRTPNLRIKTIIIVFIWFATTSVYVGLSYYAPSLGGDEYLNFFLAGVVELPTYLILWPTMEKWGRRWILCISMGVGGTACLATFLSNDDSVTLILYCIGKMGISCTFVVVLLLTQELYPTVIRGLGMGICSVFGGLGPIFIPLINHLGTEMLTLPLIIMGFLLILGGLSALLLPETLHKNLPQTLEDGEKTGLNYLQCCNSTKIKNVRSSSNESKL